MEKVVVMAKGRKEESTIRLKEEVKLEVNTLVRVPCFPQQEVLVRI